MRLLNVETLEFAEFRGADTPGYVIASHRWLADGEATFQDVRGKSKVDSAGYRKVRDFARYVRENVPSVEWLWVDTCCINKDSAAELSEAINLMFRWYRNAEICLAYLPDVEDAEDTGSFGKSEWFERGWTLQELLAPRTVVFLTKTWQVIGNKGAAFHGYDGSLVGSGLERVIAERTGIPEPFLQNYTASPSLTVEDRLKWIEGRKTSRAEDMSYALYGVFDVSPGANYGEEFNGARRRLLEAIHQEEDRAARRAEQFRNIVSWLSPPDPWSNHETARQRHEAETGAWFLASDAYRGWKTGSIHHLWVYGKAGCGKTILSSTATEDIRAHCASRTDSHYAAFYFSFSETSKQSLQGLLQSLVAQCGWKETAFSMLQEAYNRPGRQSMGLDNLQKVLLASSGAYEELFFVIDALDECPEDNDARQNTMRCLVALADVAPNLRILVTSRDEPDIRESMRDLGVCPLSIAEGSVSADIRKHVATQLSRDYRLSRLSAAAKTQIEETLTSKADGMFRWVDCQVQELKKLKSTRPSAINQALSSLPATLDETYERMLTRLEPGDRVHAFRLLQWLAYAKYPLNLGELGETMIIDLDGKGSVDVEDRAGLEDPLEILSGLVIVIEEEADDWEDISDSDSTTSERTDMGSPEDDSPAENGDQRDNLEGDGSQLSRRRNGYTASDLPSRTVNRSIRVRLAHFSVKEYLESTRIFHSDARDFHLQAGTGHRLLAQSCLVYLLNYSSNDQKSWTKQDNKTFPLLEYAAERWYHHSALQQARDVTREVALLGSAYSLRDWLSRHNPDKDAFGNSYNGFETASGLYYASLLGLDGVIQTFLREGINADLEGGLHGTALNAASFKGHETVVQKLLRAGADVNAQHERVGSALSKASEAGNDKIVETLLTAGADVNAKQADGGSALIQGSEWGRERVVRMLLDAGAEVNAQRGKYGNALQVACWRGHEQIIRMLLNAGAKVNAQGGEYGNALRAASYKGHEQTVRMLLDAGAEVNAQGGEYDSALAAAVAWDYTRVVRTLLDAGADVSLLSERQQQRLETLLAKTSTEGKALSAS